MLLSYSRSKPVFPFQFGTLLAVIICPETCLVIDILLHPWYKGTVGLIRKG